MIENYILAKAFDEIYSLIKNSMRETPWKLKSSKGDIEESIAIHLKEISNWSSEVSFKDLNRARKTNDIYIELNLYAIPLRRRYAKEKIKKVPLTDMLLDSESHIILLGQPGAGKTTSMKKLCHTIFTEDIQKSIDSSLPILIKAREINKTNTHSDNSIIINILYNILGLHIDFDDSDPIEDDRANLLKERIVSITLNELGALLIIDVFDEIVSPNSRKLVIDDIRKLCMLLDSSRIILTSRTGDFEYHIEGASQYEISPLSNEQVASFSHKWLRDEKRANQFLKDVYSTPYGDTALRPLTLSHLCVIYDRTGKIPDKPKTIYKKIINLLLEEWDEQRSVERISKYAAFETDRKFEFLSQLSYVLTSDLKKTVFNSEDIETAYGKIFSDYGLEPGETKLVVNELETHTGLILQTGIDEFEFAHKSLQEYLAAEYIVKLPIIPYSKDGIFEMPNELAIAVAISSKPSDYLAEFVLRRLSASYKRIPAGFIHAFLSRLFLEKPDFNYSNLLGLSMIFLYSVNRKNSKIKSTERSRKSLIEIESILKKIVTKEMIHYIRSFYSVESKTKELIMLYRKIDGELGYVFPDSLAIKKEIWNLK